MLEAALALQCRRLGLIESWRMRVRNHLLMPVRAGKVGEQSIPLAHAGGRIAAAAHNGLRSIVGRLGRRAASAVCVRAVAGAALAGGDYSIAGMTLSGGLWPSTKVLMLMITFSPMSIRLSTVADPMCGSNTTLGSFSSLGLMAGSFS